jgi:serralysin
MPDPNTSSPTSSFSLTGNFSLDPLLNELHRKWGGTVGAGVTLSFSFPWSSDSAFWQDSYGAGEPASLLSFDPGQSMTAARNALQAWANVANLNFVEVSESPTEVGDFRFAFSYAVTDAWGWSRYPNSSRASAADVWVNPQIRYDSWMPGSYNFMGLMHEIGHGLGLKHSGNYNTGEAVGSEGPYLPAWLDFRNYTIMSYNNPASSSYVDQTFGATVRVYAQTPMVYDIAAIQYLYGANNNYKTGDDTYLINPSSPSYKTLWDAGGMDTISVANFTYGCLINLAAGSYSNLHFNYWNGVNNLGIAFGATIENAIGGNGNDAIYGNGISNIITGGYGADFLVGHKGNDTINGGAGSDVLGGGSGADVLDGGTESDILYGGSENDMLIGGLGADILYAGSENDSLDGGVGSDTLYGGSETDAIRGGSGADILFGGIGNDLLNGDLGNDVLYGGSGTDAVNGGEGNDVLNGGLEGDILTGGVGNDTYYAGMNDIIVELAEGGIDKVISFVDWIGADYIENVTLMGSATYAVGNDSNNRLIGNTLINTLTGSLGEDTLRGAKGNDVLFGGLDNDMLAGGYGYDSLDGGEGDDVLSGSIGKDTLTGGSGQDIFRFTNFSIDTITDFSVADDTIWLTKLVFTKLTVGILDVSNFMIGAQALDANDYVIYNKSVGVLFYDADGNGSKAAVQIASLGASVDLIYSNIIINTPLMGNSDANNIQGNMAANLIGGRAGDDILYGDAGSDTLYGGSGNDTLDGGTGADKLYGGVGDDSYYVNSSYDLVIESTLATGGVDIVYSSANFSLATLAAAGVEKLTLTGTLAINGTGNAKANSLTGNDAANRLNGGYGTDSLDGGAGNDILNGGFGKDTLTGGDGQDIFKLTNFSVDSITDFNITDDTLQLENAVFTKLGAVGTLNSDKFIIGTAAVDNNDYVIYDSGTGALFYDANGNTSGGITQIALLGPGLALTNADFTVI